MNIAHITILNPIDHTRILKYAKTQADLGYFVYVIGKKTSQIPHQSINYQYFSTGKINRNFLPRLITHLKILFWWLKNNQNIDVFWIHTPELFWLFILNYLLNKKQVYDVHENYFENIYFADYYPSWIKKPLALFVKKIEKWIAQIAWIVYAEYCYENILQAKNYEIIPNAFDDSLISKEFTVPNKGIDIRMIVSGNLSEEWGTLQAIDFWETQNQFYPAFLIIAGYAPLIDFAQKIRERINKSPFKNRCELIGIEQYVPYHEVLKAIQKSHIVLAPYQIKKKFLNKIPTKFYEAIAMKKTILFSNIPYWNQLNEQYSFGFCVHNWQEKWEYKLITDWKIPKSFYDWQEQKPKILKIIKKL